MQHINNLGDREKTKKILQELSDKQGVNLAGPTAVEEILFQQVLESRRESLIDMRKPENYSKRGDKKRFVVIKDNILQHHYFHFKFICGSSCKTIAYDLA